MDLVQVSQLTHLLHQFLKNESLSWVKMFGASDIIQEVVDALDAVVKWLNVCYIHFLASLKDQVKLDTGVTNT